MKENRIILKNSKIRKRFVSLLTSVAVATASLPMSYIAEFYGIISNRMSAFAAGTGEEHTFNDIISFKDYVESYDVTHKNDKLIFAISDNASTTVEISIDEPMGKNPSEAFDGSITIQEPIKFNMSKPLFTYVTDDVEINFTNNGGSAIEFTRPTEGTKAPLFAEHVVNKRASGDAVKWNFQYDKFSATNVVYDFAGFIGTMEAGAKVEIENVVLNNTGIDQNNNPKTANITANTDGDAGLICGTMKSDAELTVYSVTCSGDNADNSFSITASSTGNAGGLVGSMAEGSTLTLGSTLSCAQAAGAEIKASKGYAGGIVGRCEKGIIVNNRSSYAVVQNINGDSGSGGVAGYYETSDSNKEIGTDIVDLTPSNNSAKYSVNGAGQCGGLFGEVFNNGRNMTITVGGDITPDHSSGEAQSYGGLIGKYYSSAQTLSLTVEGTSSKKISPRKSGGKANYYGGVIGNVDLYSNVSSYVKIDGVTVDSKNAAASSFFGGVIAKADEAFVELTNTNEISYSGITKDNKFAGVVGSLENGVLCLSGSTDLSGAESISAVKEPSGQIVGYRNCGFVFAKSGWKLYRSTAGQKVDDIGSWGEVIRFNDSTFKMTDVITLDATNHYVKINKRTQTNYHKDVLSTTDFAILALNAQHNSGIQGKVLRFDDITNFKSITILTAKDISFKNNPIIDLRGTGITGLTRDNEYSSDKPTDYLEFQKNINGNGATIILAIGEKYGYIKDSSEESGEREVTVDDIGCGKIYRHKYNGFLAKANNGTNGVINSSSTASSASLKISNLSEINVEACIDNMNVGTLVACASGSIKINRVETLTDSTVGASHPKMIINYSGSGKDFYVGGLVGKAEGDVTFGDTYSCSFNGQILGSSGSSAIVGGLIGCITSSSFTSTINNATVSGTIKSEGGGADQKIGGIIGVISNGGGSSSLTLKNISVSSLTVESNATTSSGGLLGYGWYKTNVNFGDSSNPGVEITSSKMKTTAKNTAGLVYEGTGHWIVKNNSTKNGIKISSAEVDAAKAESFGGIINKGCANNSAIYLEIKNGGYNITKNATTSKSNLNLTNLKSSVDVFDEIAAYSKFDNTDITDNGQAIISIDTANNALLKMGSEGTASTYQNQSDFTPKFSDVTNYCNPNTRYYYNLGSYNNSSNEAQKFLIWSVKEYAHSSISSNFTGGSSGSANAAIDLRGYSYYPINIDAGKSYIISGNISLWNNEFDTTEDATTWKRKSFGTARNSQHYLMQNGLFLNVNGSLNATSLQLNGDVSKISDTLCGALVMGNVSSNSSTDPATVNINDLELNGIKINGTHNASTYAPLLINTSGSNSTFDIRNVKTSNSSTNVAYDGNDIIASSLIGDLGSSSANFVKVSFRNIKLDGRNTTGNIDSLDGVYYTKKSLFSRATLLNSLKYSDNSSYGTYYFSFDEDYDTTNSNTKLGGVTYGKEIRDTIENREVIPESDPPATISKQLKYDGSIEFVRPKYSSSTDTNGYEGFSSNYQNYVYDSYVAQNNTDNKHELRVNIASASFSGCGTYNDPYLITKGDDLDTIAKIINGTATGGKISVPKSVIDDTDLTVSWCSDSNDHYTFTSLTRDNSSRASSTWSTSDSTPVTISDSDLAKYLAGAYYKLDTTNDIVLNADFTGISNGVDSDYIFHGIIDGSGKTIKNGSTSSPLIVSSNGCVIRDLTVYADSASAISLTSNGAKYDSTSESAPAYGVLIGKVLGGDNIIDKVITGYTGTGKISISKGTGNAEIVPVGGYVGVVVNGGVIFRNMSSVSENDRKGITDYAFTSPENPVTSDDYLYINPIIGRVLNGYAVTVAGTNNSSNDYKARENDVTMKNGTKNYSIADIDPDLDKLATVSATNTIQLPNAQSMFILSLLTQSGLTVTSYGDYGSHFHKADYDEIGSSATSTGDYANVSATSPPYLLENYFDSTVLTSLFTLTDGTTAWNFSLGGTDLEWEIPDGFRGIGSLGFRQTNDAYVTARTFNLKSFSGVGSYGTETDANADGVPDNIINLKLNINVKHYSSGVDNYVPVNTGNGGLGLFDKFRQINENSTDMISNVRISGKINYDIPDITIYSSTYVEKKYLHVGGLAGCIGTGAATDKDNIIVEQINIDGLEINGFESAGGFFGYMKMASSASGKVDIYNVSADTFKVTAKRYAGGMIGYFGQGNLIVSDVEITQPNILTYYRGINNKDFANGAGGIVGYALNTNSNIPIQFSNVQLGSLKSEADDPSSFSISSRIGYAEGVTFNQTYVGTQNSNHNDTIVAGGLIGRSHTYVTSGYTYSMILTNCKVYNIDVYGHKVGGLLGSDIDKDSKIHITDCKVISDTDKKAQVYGMTIDAKDRGCGGIIGGNSNGGLDIDDCQVKGYILQGRNDTAAVCAWHDTGKLTIHNLLIKDVVIRSDYAGILVGYQNADIEGYNILTDNVQFQDKDKSVVTDLTKKNIGYIVGKNLNAKSTKIVGFTRQNTTPETGYFVPDRMTGQGSKSTLGSGSTSTSDKFSYGGGYVIFADYQGSQDGTTFSGINDTNNITGAPAAPYVYSSPSVTISDGDESQDTSPQILTGDGVNGYGYSGSSAGKIFANRSDTSNKKRYQTADIAQPTILKKVLENNLSSFSRELQKSNISYNGKNFPVLVIDDKDNVDTIVKDYIRLLTNTSYKYDGKTTAESSIYSINVSKMKYNSTKKNFETPIDQSTNHPEPAALIYSSNTGKYSIGDVYDNTDERFSLIDVQFKDPSKTTQIAYHLYIPVMVEKCLYYTVQIRPASGTTYKLDEYPTKASNLIENLGNPITLKLTYTYSQGYNEWTKAINSGENVLRNYDKKLIIRTTSISSPSKVVIVDPNNNSDTMRCGDFSTSGTAPMLTMSGSDYILSIADSNQVCKLNDLMKVSIDPNGTEKKLVSCSETAATVKINDPNNSSGVTLLCPATDSQLSDTSVTKYAVKVSDWETKNMPEENYYVSIFTKEAPEDHNIYHYEIDTAQSFGDLSYPSSKTNGEVPHILIGNLYSNTVTTVNEGNPDTIISKSNNTLSATITAEVGFSQYALNANIVNLIERNENIKIYQEFLVSLQKIIGDAQSMGIELSPECSFTYSINGTPISNTELLDCKEIGIYVEFPTNHSIKNALLDKITEWKQTHSGVNTITADECNITITSTVSMSYAKYDVDKLANQFPERSSADTNGSKIVGYSKIASAPNSVALSHASHDKAGSLLYKMESASPVILNYMVDENENFSDDGNANYGQLGINAEPDAGELIGGKSKIKSLISYDASDYGERTKACYLKIDFTLANKTTNGNTSSYGSALTINDYLSNFSVNGYLYQSEDSESEDDEEETDTGEETTGEEQSGEEQSNESQTTQQIEVTDSRTRSYIIPLSLFDNDGRYDFVIPVEFDVYSGNNSNFELRTPQGSKYSNYRVYVTVGLLDDNKQPLPDSAANDWIIYTNARIKRDIITPRINSNSSNEQNGD